MDETDWCLSCEKYLATDRWGAYCSLRCRNAATPSTSTASSDIMNNDEEDPIYHRIHAILPPRERIVSWAQEVPCGADAQPFKPRSFKRPACMSDTTKHPSGTRLHIDRSFPLKPSPPVDTPPPQFRSDNPPTPSPESALSGSFVSTPSSSFFGCGHPEPPVKADSPKRSGLLATITSTLRLPGHGSPNPPAPSQAACQLQASMNSSPRGFTVLAHAFHNDGDVFESSSSSFQTTPTKTSSARRAVHSPGSSHEKHTAYEKRGRRLSRCA